MCETNLSFKVQLIQFKVLLFLFFPPHNKHLQQPRMCISVHILRNSHFIFIVHCWIVIRIFSNTPSWFCIASVEFLHFLCSIVFLIYFSSFVCVLSLCLTVDCYILPPTHQHTHVTYQVLSTRGILNKKWFLLTWAFPYFSIVRINISYKFLFDSSELFLFFFFSRFRFYTGI